MSTKSQWPEAALFIIGLSFFLFFLYNAYLIFYKLFVPKRRAICDENVIDEINEGITTKANVKAMFGKPCKWADFSNGALYEYTYRGKFGWFLNTMCEASLNLYFDDSGVVTKKDSSITWYEYTYKVPFYLFFTIDKYDWKWYPIDAPPKYTSSRTKAKSEHTKTGSDKNLLDTISTSRAISSRVIIIGPMILLLVGLWWWWFLRPTDRSPFLRTSGPAPTAPKTIDNQFSDEASFNNWRIRYWLNRAISRGDLPAVKRLLTEGADVNAKDENGSTALMSASICCKPEVVKLLLANGADVNAKTTGFIDGLGRPPGTTALMVASRWGCTEVVEVLLAADANVNAKDNHGGTALMWASSRGRREIVEALLAANADVNAKGDVGETALTLASKRGHRKIQEILIEAGAKKSWWPW